MPTLEQAIDRKLGIVDSNYIGQWSAVESAIDTKLGIEAPQEPAFEEKEKHIRDVLQLSDDLELPYRRVIDEYDELQRQKKEYPFGRLEKGEDEFSFRKLFRNLYDKVKPPSLGEATPSQIYHELKEGFKGVVHIGIELLVGTKTGGLLDVAAAPADVYLANRKLRKDFEAQGNTVTDVGNRYGPAWKIEDKEGNVEFIRPNTVADKQFASSVAEIFDRIVGLKVKPHVKTWGEIAKTIGTFKAAAKLRGPMPQGIGALGKVGHAGQVGSIYFTAKELKKGVTGDESYRGVIAVIEGALVFAALSLIGSGIGGIWQKLKPTEQGKALKLLGLKRGATEGDIVAASRRAFLRYHPDKVAGMQAEFEKVIKARSILLNPDYGKDIIRRGSAPSAAKLLTGVTKEGVPIKPVKPPIKIEPEPIALAPKPVVPAPPQAEGGVGSTKVVGDNGKPLTVYHGTTGSFNKIQRGKGPRAGEGLDDLGVWFTASQEEAGVYSAKGYEWEGSVKEAQINIVNPLEFGSPEAFLDWVKSYATFHGKSEDLSKLDIEAIRERLRLGGKDGIIIRKGGKLDNFKTEADWFMVLDDSQIIQPTQPTEGEVEKATPVISNPEVAKSVGETKPDILSGVKTGKPVSIDVVRGSGRATKGEVYESGEGEPAFGDARYSAIDRTVAEAFGPKVEELTVRLDNPFVLTNDEQLAELVGEPVPRDNTARPVFLKKARAEIERRGHDGIIINISNFGDVDATGKSAKRLIEISGATQVIEFKPKAPLEEPISEFFRTQPTEGLTKREAGGVGAAQGLLKMAKELRAEIQPFLDSKGVANIEALKGLSKNKLQALNKEYQEWLKARPVAEGKVEGLVQLINADTRAGGDLKRGLSFYRAELEKLSDSDLAQALDWARQPERTAWIGRFVKDNIAAVMRSRGLKPERTIAEAIEAEQIAKTPLFRPAAGLEPLTDKEFDKFADGMRPGFVDIESYVDALKSAHDWIFTFGEVKRLNPELFEKLMESYGKRNASVEKAIAILKRTTVANLTAEEAMELAITYEDKRLVPPQGLEETFEGYKGVLDKTTELTLKKGILQQTFQERMIAENDAKIADLRDKTPKSKKIAELVAENEELRQIRYLPHSIVARRAIEARLFELKGEERKTYLDSIARISAKFKKRGGKLFLKDYLDEGILKPGDIDIRRLTANALTDFYYRSALKDLFDYAEASELVKPDLKASKQQEEMGLETGKELRQQGWQNQQEIGIISPELKGKLVHPLFASSLAEMKEMKLGKGHGTLRQILAMVKIGQFIKPSIIWTYNAIQAFTEGIWGLHPIKDQRLLSEAYLTVVGKNALYHKLNESNLYQFPYEVGRNAFEEQIEQYIRQNSPEISRLTKLLEKTTDMTWKAEDLNIKKMIMVGHRALANLTWTGDKVQRTHSYLILRKMGYPHKEAVKVAANSHGAYSALSEKFKKTMSPITFVYSFRILMPMRRLKLLTDSFIGVPEAFIKGESIPKYKWNRWIMAWVGTVMLPVLTDMYMKERGFEKEGDWFKDLPIVKHIPGIRRWPLAWKWKKTITLDGKEQEIVVGINNILNMPVKYWNRITYHNPIRPEARWHQAIGRLIKWEIHPLWRIFFWDIRENRKSFGTGNTVYDVNASWPEQFAQTTAYVFGQSFRFWGGFMDTVGEGQMTDKERNAQEVVFDEGLNKLDKFFFTVFGYKYIRAPLKERKAIAMASLKKEMTRRAIQDARKYEGKELQQRNVDLKKWMKKCVQWINRGMK